MILFPAIDLKEGCCVRLQKGKMNSATVYAKDPVAQAKSFEQLGCEWLHIVDLDGAFSGHPQNIESVISILTHTSLKIQLGGGIRNLTTIEKWFEKGITRIILGTIFVQDTPLAQEACRLFPGRIVAGIDARANKVAISGWTETTCVNVISLAKKCEDIGAAAIIYTEIERDGILAGLNVQSTVALAEVTSIPIIASGGLSGLEDIKHLLNSNCPRLEGIIAGRAIYNGQLNVRETLDFFHSLCTTC